MSSYDLYFWTNYTFAFTQRLFLTLFVILHVSHGTLGGFFLPFFHNDRHLLSMSDDLISPSNNFRMESLLSFWRELTWAESRQVFNSANEQNLTSCLKFWRGSNLQGKGCWDFLVSFLSIPYNLHICLIFWCYWIG